MNVLELIELLEMFSYNLQIKVEVNGQLYDLENMDRVENDFNDLIIKVKESCGG